MILYHVPSEDFGLTDWIIDPAAPNTDIATLPQSETDINDVTFVKMIAKLTENVCTLRHPKLY